METKKREATVPTDGISSDDDTHIDFQLDDFFGEVDIDDPEEAPTDRKTTSPPKEIKTPPAEIRADNKKRGNLKLDDLPAETDANPSPKKLQDRGRGADTAAPGKPLAGEPIATPKTGNEEKTQLPENRKKKDPAVGKQIPAHRGGGLSAKKDTAHEKTKKQVKGKIPGRTVPSKGKTLEIKDVHAYAKPVTLGGRKKKPRRGLYTACGGALILLAGTVSFFTMDPMGVLKPDTVEKRPVSPKNVQPPSASASKSAPTASLPAKEEKTTPETQHLEKIPLPALPPEKSSAAPKPQASTSPDPQPQAGANATAPGVFQTSLENEPVPVKKIEAKPVKAIPLPEFPPEEITAIPEPQASTSPALQPKDKERIISPEQAVQIEKIPPKRYPYTIHIASYSSFQTSKKNIGSFRKMALQPYLVRFDLGKKGIWYRLFVGHFNTAEEALQMIREKGLKEATPYLAAYAAFIGTYASRKELNAGIQRLSEKGYNFPYVIEGRNAGHHLYLGAFKVRKEAEAFAATLGSKGIRAQVAER